MLALLCSFEVNTSLVFYDWDMAERDVVAQGMVQPLAEAWAGMPLEFTSFYGVQECVVCLRRRRRLRRRRHLHRHLASPPIVRSTLWRDGSVAALRTPPP